MGGFEFIVLRRNLKECHERPFASPKEAAKVTSTATVSGTVY